MPGMTRPGPARRQEDPLLARPRQAALLTAGVVAVTAVVFALVAGHGTLARIQRLDDAWLRLMISGRAPPLTAIAKVLNVLGLVYVTLPARIALAGFLALRRRWWHLAAFTAAIVLSEVLIGPLKGVYDRTRPPGSLVATTNASFPSGHAIAASVTVIAAVIALVPAGRRRALWGAAAVTFSIVMGLSRAYLAAHWLSDATAGILLGTSCALVTALIADQFQRRHNRGQRAAGTQCLAQGPPLAGGGREKDSRSVQSLLRSQGVSAGELRRKRSALAGSLGEETRWPDGLPGDGARRVVLLEDGRDELAPAADAGLVEDRPSAPRHRAV